MIVDVTVPAYGYCTYVLTEKDKDDKLPLEFPMQNRVEKEYEYMLENDYIKVIFDIENATITSMVYKPSGKELLDGCRPAGIFRVIEEDDAKGMTSWIVGRYMNIYNLNKDVKIGKVHMDKTSLRQWISYEIQFRSSKLNVTISLDYCSRRLDYNIECDWQEVSKKGKYIPQLNFYMPVGYECGSYKYDIPFGTITRQVLGMDVPGNSWVAGLPEDNGKEAVMLITNTKYGFRGVDNSMAITLIRSSYAPDPYPENGIHKFKFAVKVIDITSNLDLILQAYDYNHPVKFVSGAAHKGSLPFTNSYITVESGTVAISAVKMPEGDTAGKKLVIRVYETEGINTKAVLDLAGKVKKAYFVDVNEKHINTGLNISADGGKVNFDVAAYSIANILVELQQQAF